MCCEPRQQDDICTWHIHREDQGRTEVTMGDERSAAIGHGRERATTRRIVTHERQRAKACPHFEHGVTHTRKDA